MSSPRNFESAAAQAMQHTHALRRLESVAHVREELTAVERDAVEQAVAAGYTWSAIASALGVTRQAVSKKHAAPDGTGVDTRRARIVADRQSMAERDAQIEQFAIEHLERVRRRSAGAE